jgi:3-dehydroquinate dehydratase-1
MICVSIAEPNLRACRRALRGIDLAEIRLDRMRLTGEEIGALFSLPVKLIAACRPGKATENARKSALLTAVEAGAAYVDIEVEASRAFRLDIRRAARRKGCRVIISYHNFAMTPSDEILKRMLQRCFAQGAEIAKVVCRVRSGLDCARILSLYKTRGKVIALGMGPKGVITRIAAPLLGAPFTYASLAPGKETAAGQLDWRRHKHIVDMIQDG